MTNTINCPHCGTGQGDPYKLPITDRPCDGWWSRLSCFRCRKTFAVEFRVLVSYQTHQHPGHMPEHLEMP